MQYEDESIEGHKFIIFTEDSLMKIIIIIIIVYTEHRYMIHLKSPMLLFPHTYDFSKYDFLNKL